MTVLQSAVAAAWGTATPARAALAAPWSAAAPAQSIGSPYAAPPAPPGSTVAIPGDLTARSEILPAAAYRSAASVVMRNARALGDPFRYFYAPLLTGAQDTVDPLAAFTVIGSPTFTPAGMLSSAGAWVNYPDTNAKLNTSAYAVGIRYRVRCENLTSMPPPFNSSGTRIFTLNGLGHQFGFMTGVSGTLRVYEFRGVTSYPEVSLGVIPDDSVLSIVYPAGSGVGELWIDDTKVYTSPVDARFAGGITLGLQSSVALSSVRFSQLRMERIPALTDGLALEDGQIVNAISGSIDLPDGSALWRVSATVARAAYELMRSGEQPPLVSVALAGKTWVFVVDEMSAPRAFASTDVSIRGVSLAALADAPYELARQWTSEAPTTAAQIATLAQTFTGLTVSWQLPDWPVPAGGWSFTGTPWGAVLQPAAAVGAVVEADRAALAVKITSRYPTMPNEWAASVPDVQIPWQAVESETVISADKPGYTGVYVTGPAATVAAVRLAGTSGSEQAPLVAGDLLTDLDGQIEQGRTLLAQSGGAQTVTRALQVLTGAGEPGVIDRGALVRWVDPNETWVGMARAVRVDWQFAQVRQTVACERHTSFPAGSAAPTAAALPAATLTLYQATTSGTGAIVSKPTEFTHKVVTSTGAASFFYTAWVRDSATHSGLKYCEFEIIGIGDSSASTGRGCFVGLARDVGDGSIPSNPFGEPGVVYFSNINYNGGSPGVANFTGVVASGDFTTANVVCMAVDYGTGAVWFRVNGGAWIGGGDPAAGSSPSVTLASSPGALPHFGFYARLSGSNFEIRFRAQGDAFSYPAPAGFSVYA